MKAPVRFSTPAASSTFLRPVNPASRSIASAQTEMKLDGGNGGRNTLQGDMITPERSKVGPANLSQAVNSQRRNHDDVEW